MKDFIPVFGPQGELTPELIQDALGLASLEVALGIIAAWTPNERALAYDYAMRLHLHASDNHSIRLRDLPWFIAMSVVASAPGATVIIPEEFSRLFSQGTGVQAPAERNATLQRDLGGKSWDSE